MNLLYRLALVTATWHALWRLFVRRTVPLRANGEIVTWAYGDGRDDSLWLQKAINAGGVVVLPGYHRVGRTLRVGTGTYLRGTL